MKESYRKGVANHPDLEFCGGCREALTDVTAKVVIYEAFVKGKLEASKALADKSFSPVVSQCSDFRLLRCDFRLFVWLTGGLTPINLRELANTYEACSLLLESVHLPRNQTAVTAGAVADLLDQYFSELAEYRSELAARSIGKWGA